MSKEPSALGSCNCGAVKFAVFSELADVYVCHCSICRKSTGSGGIAVSVVANTAFEFTEGVDYISRWDKPNHDWMKHFCRVCGSPLPGENDQQTTFIPVSLLDSGDKNLTVKHHIFVDSKACWEQIPRDGKHHNSAFEGE
ncbi:GFA family protein [Shewanella waksmanii]|uniref:GFA family protein n=1 Tax=Shewanella waksmanii TaxID=213783 RepID=UPI003736CFA0